MFSKISSRIGRTVMGGLVVGSIGLGLLSGGGAAHAQDNVIIIGDGTPCSWGGVSYPEGSTMQIGDMKFVCIAGVWEQTFDTLTGAGMSAAHQDLSVSQDAPVVKPLKTGFHVAPRRAAP